MPRISKIIPQISVPADTDILAAVQNGQTKRVSLEMLKNYFAKTENVIEIKVVDYTTDVAVGDGKAHFIIPEEMAGMKLVRVAATVITAGTGDSTTIQIHNVTDNVDMLSTVMSIESGEKSTRTSASPGVIDTAHNDVAAGDDLSFDVKTVSTTAPQGLICEMSFRLP